jgi:hypothetical protein
MDSKRNVKVNVTSITAATTGIFGSFSSFNVTSSGFKVDGDIIYFNVYGHGSYLGVYDGNLTEFMGYYDTATGYFSITGYYKP